MRYELGPADRHAGLAFHRLRFLPSPLKEELGREGLWEDLVQEVYTAALEAWKQGMDDRQTLCHAASRLYQFLKAYGYHRNGRKDQAHIRRESPFSVTLDTFDIPNKGLPRNPFGVGRHLFDEAEAETEAPLDRLRGLIKESPQGIGKWELFGRVRIPAPLFHQALASLVEKGLVHEEVRENPGHCGPATTVVVPGPASQEANPDKKERIRRAYQEGKNISQIAREIGCTRHTVRRVTGDLRPAA